MIIISTTLGKNPLEEVGKKETNRKKEIGESPHNQQESEMQYLGATSKMTEWSQFISKASHSTSQ